MRRRNGSRARGALLRRHAARDCATQDDREPRAHQGELVSLHVVRLLEENEPRDQLRRMHRSVLEWERRRRLIALVDHFEPVDGHDSEDDEQRHPAPQPRTADRAGEVDEETIEDHLEEHPRAQLRDALLQPQRDGTEGRHDVVEPLWRCRQDPLGLQYLSLPFGRGGVEPLGGVQDAVGAMVPQDGTRGGQDEGEQYEEVGSTRPVLRE
mmetsp:Transcript_3955/g.8606  ORF Transcript_3955/g.8606 Transcript_3955/m.8606 type:complete len:210 (-) Transcript_3955:358-987(-)